MKIEFKTIPVFFRKEYLGLKNNTVRVQDDPEDIRFEILNNFISGKINLLNIVIINPETQEQFTRIIRDVVDYKGTYIITWFQGGNF